MPPIMKDRGKGDGDNSPQDSESQWVFVHNQHVSVVMGGGVRGS